MNITSYNVTDVAYHYIGLRVLASMPNAPREEQFAAVSRNVLKYASEKALRLMLPEPRGTFETVGEKVLQELKHFCLASPAQGRGYQLTQHGELVLTALNSKEYASLRRVMAELHLAVYDNLRALVRHYLDAGPIFIPTVEAERIDDKNYIRALLAPTFGNAADAMADELTDELKEMTPKKVEDALREQILSHFFPGERMSVPLFRSMGDRLVSLRLVNTMRVSIDGCGFDKHYTPCVSQSPPHPWYKKLSVSPDSGDAISIYMSEPDMADAETKNKLLLTLDAGFSALTDEGGYYDLPDVRDFTCERLMIPEAAFDEGINSLLDLHPSPLTVGLQYERISGRRKPLIRSRESVQIYNLIRRA